MRNNIGDYIGQGLMGFSQNFAQGQQNAQQAAMQQARLEDMQYQRQRQDKQDYMQSYRQGIEELSNEALLKVANGQSLEGTDPYILRNIDPTKLLAIQEASDTRNWKRKMGMVDQPPGLMSPQGQQAPQQAPMTPGGGGEPAVPQGQIKDLIDYWSRYHGANPADVYPVAKVESNYQQTDPRTGKILTSPAGARGVMQLMPGTAQGMGVNPDDVSDNINGGVKYLKQQMDRYGDPYLAYRAYNGGPGNVESNATVPYANKVFGLRQQMQGGQQPPLGPQVAQAGPQTMTDASGRPPVQGQQYGGQGGGSAVDIIKQKMKLPAAEFAAFVMAAPKGQQQLLIDMYKQSNPEASAALREFNAYSGMSPDQQSQFASFKRLSKPETTIDMKQETAEGQAFGKALVDDYTGVREKAQAAEEELNAVLAARNIPVQTGSLEPAKAAAAAVLQSLGVDPSKMNLPDPSNAQAFNAAIGNVVLGKAGSMKGTISDKDIAFLKQTMAGLGATPQANAMMLDMSEKLARRKIEKFDFYNSYREENGSLNGASKAWGKHVNSNPLFQPAENQGQPTSGQAQSPAPTFPEGATVKDKATNKLFKIVNGQPQPLE